MKRDGILRAILLGSALAILTRSTRHLPGDMGWVKAVGVPWLAVAFAAAAGVPRVRRGAVLGALSLAVAILVYYAVLAFVQHAYDHSPIGVAWLAVAVPGGAIFGALGSMWAADRARVTIAALLTACFAGEAIIFAGLYHAAAAPFLLTTAALLPLILVRSAADRMRALALALPLVLLAVAAEASVLAATGYLVRG